jgi:hypothetical protein
LRAQPKRKSERKWSKAQLMQAIDDKNYVLVFRSGKLDEIEMATKALQEAHVPYCIQKETPNCLIEATPELPAPWLACWVIRVPQEAEGQAQKILAALPLEMRTSPAASGLRPFAKVKSGWRAFAIGMLLVMLVWLIKALV